MGFSYLLSQLFAFHISELILKVIFIRPLKASCAEGMSAVLYHVSLYSS